MRFLLSSLLLCLAAAWPACAGEPAKRPNVLLIISDDQGWSDYGFMGHQQIETPNLDRLASESLAFLRGYTPVALCRPSLATMLTGLQPHRHGITGNDPVLPDPEAKPVIGRRDPRFRAQYQAVVDRFASRPNLVRDLTSKGYVALQTGKWWEGDPVRTAGFTHAMTDGNTPQDRHGGAGLSIGRDGIKPITDFIEAAGDKPWIVWYAPMLPHSPHTPPERLLRKYLKTAPSEPVARYWACVEWFDETCGQLIDHLDARKLREDTVIVYACDNGWLQDPGNRDRFLARSKLSPYEGGVRTPILFSRPGTIAHRVDRNMLASNIDIWPTLASLLGTGLPGVDLTSPAAAARKYIHGADFTHEIADLADPAASLRSRWIIEGPWKLILPDPRNRPQAKAELHHLLRDPWEREDLAAGEPQRVKHLSGLLDREWQRK